MPALLQTHPNHSSSSTRERLKRWSQRRETKLLSLLWDWVFYAVCWKWLTILWNEFDGTQLSLCRTNKCTWAKTRQMQLSSWQPPGSPCSWHRRKGATGSPLARLLLVDVDRGSAEKLLLPLPFRSLQVSVSICNAFQFLSVSSSSVSLALMRINSL